MISVTKDHTPGMDGCLLGDMNPLDSDDHAIRFFYHDIGIPCHPLPMISVYFVHLEMTPFQAIQAQVTWSNEPHIHKYRSW